MKITRTAVITFATVVGLLLLIPKGLPFTIAYSASDGSKLTISGPTEIGIAVSIVLIALAIVLYVTKTKNNEVLFDIGKGKLKLRTKK